MIGTRIQLARDAAKAILKTLTWKDQLGFVLFSDVVGQIREPVFVTDDARASIEDWIDTHIVADGSTTFYEPMMRALEMVETYASCSNVVLFLTDGIAEFTEENYLEVSSTAHEHDTVIFTYALGDGTNYVKYKLFFIVQYLTIYI